MAFIYLEALTGEGKSIQKKGKNSSKHDFLKR